MLQAVAANHGTLPHKVTEQCHGDTVRSYIGLLCVREAIWRQHQTAVYIKICVTIFYLHTRVDQALYINQQLVASRQCT